MIPAVLLSLSFASGEWTSVTCQKVCFSWAIIQGQDGFCMPVEERRLKVEHLMSKDIQWSVEFVNIGAHKNRLVLGWSAWIPEYGYWRFGYAWRYIYFGRKAE